jgi:RNA polymerase sigma-70 factor (ECF subfamily)
MSPQGSAPDGEAALIAAAATGEAPAFARLVQRHQAPVRGFLRRLSGNHADADDLAQETFVTAWTRLASFRPGASFRAWLCGVAYRKWLARARSEGRRLRREREAEPDMPAAANPDHRLDAATALAALPPEQRAAVALCLAAEFSHAEAAAALDLPLGTVKSHVTRGRAKLLELLGGPGERS